MNITGMSLTDAERLAIIDNAYRSLMNYRNLVNYYTRKNISVSYLRAKKRTTPTGCWLSTARRMNATGNIKRTCLCC